MTQLTDAHSFAGQVAAVTGAAGGIGGAIADQLRVAGATVIRIDCSTSVEQACSGSDIPLVADVTDPDLVDRVGRLVDDRGGTLHHLVYAAGIQVRTNAAEITDDDWQRLLEVNLSSAYRMIRGLLPRLAAPGGTVLVVSSSSADRATAGIVPYGSVKAALSHLIRGLAVELGSRGIRCNGIAPGYVETAMTSRMLADPANTARVIGRTPLARVASTDEMAGPALFLMSSQASFVTGVILPVDGGYTLT